MRPGERDQSGIAGSPDGLGDGGLDSIFGPAGGSYDSGGEPEYHSRLERRRRETNKRGTRIMIVILAVLAVVVVGAVFLLTGNSSKATDYSGPGTGAAVVAIPGGADGADMADILYKQHVVASTRAFTNAFSANPKANQIQPGSYNLKTHMSAKLAVLALLDPASRNAEADVVVTEGATVLDVETRLEKVLGKSQHDAIIAAVGSAAKLGLPANYGKLPNSPEGFLFPATYTFDPGTTAEGALQRMVLRYIEEDRNTGFASAAKKIKVTPYDALIVASIAQAEAKYPADMSKVAQVIYNRLKAGMPLQIDATSAYAAKLKGLDPSKVIYAQIDSPYNSYLNSGLPPTPIGNPGAAALDGAVNPSAGNWLYYVNGDKAGHLAFFHDEQSFAAAVDKCRANNWGCA